MNLSRILLISAVCIVASNAAFAGWQKQESGTLTWLHAIHFTDSLNGWIAGSNGTLLSTKNGGRNWDKVRIKTSDTLRDLYFSDARNGWLLCERSIATSGNASSSYLMRTSNGGESWETVEFSGGREKASRFFFSPDGIGFAVGEGGILFRTEKEGRPWKRSPLPVRYLILDGVFTDSVNGILVGGGGTILTTRDGGSTWADAKFERAGARPKLNAVYFADRKTGWAVGNSGTIYSTADGGDTWKVQPSNVEEDLFDIAFSGRQLGFAVGNNGMILQTLDGGKNWAVEASGSRHRLERVAIAGSRAYAVGFGGVILTKEIDGISR